MKFKNATPWIYSSRFDALAIMGPPVLATLIVAIFGGRLTQIEQIPTWLWIVLVLGIDVAHVYSSLFRTYFDKEEFAKRRTLYILAPALSWLGGVAVFAAFGQGVFWSAVAYFAIYHFVRQQYGFFMLYRRGEPTSGAAYRLDQAVIYLATLYPLLYWHTYPRNFQWFSGFEVIRIPTVWPELICRVVYISALVAFVAKEFWRWKTTQTLNLGKAAMLAITAIAWATGIIVFNGDLTFTLINIVAHGVPYMALVWIYQYRKRKKVEPVQNGFLRFFQLRYVPLYVGSLFLLAFVEEGLWDWFVWKEQPALFGQQHFVLPGLVLTLLVPLLTMPQVTHYVLDAYIWRVNSKGKDEIRSLIG